ncbi:DinB family protein [Phaeocystidibacter luteus]|uniref:DinB family protein n=1 Tax=Phaeocystidibacter luteus TaxID=911197 RepID=A0A6N6RHP2_9FLAO|nr:DinB family protein [Phaeocystidibacter luteus]KAB2809849.1 DinB family protein [Phaeocystidibacter luteus]
MNQQEFARRLKEQILQLQKEVENAFYFMEAEELNMKPSEKSWSILQCIEHLNLTNAYYVKAVNRAIAKNTYPDASTESYKMGTWGKFMTEAMRPKGGNIRWKMKTFQKLRPLNEVNPKARLVEHVVFEKFNEDMSALLAALEDAPKAPWKKVKIKTLLGGMLKLRLGDAIAFVIAHSQRHVEQAMKVKRAMHG